MPAAHTVSMPETSVYEGHCGGPSTDISAIGKDLHGAGLKNKAGEYNCFLNVIIQVGTHEISIFFVVYFFNRSFHFHC